MLCSGSYLEKGWMRHRQRLCCWRSMTVRQQVAVSNSLSPDIQDSIVGENGTLQCPGLTLWWR